MVVLASVGPVSCFCRFYVLRVVTFFIHWINVYNINALDTVDRYYDKYLMPGLVSHTLLVLPKFQFCYFVRPTP